MIKRVLFLLTVFSVVLVFNLFADFRNVVWDKPFFESVNCVKIADLFNNGEKLLIVSAEKGIFALDKNGEIKWYDKTFSNISEIYVEDIDNDGKNEVVGTDGLNIFVIRLDGFKTEYSITSFSTGPLFLKIEDIDGDSIDEIITYCDNSVYVLNLEPPDEFSEGWLQLKWQFNEDKGFFMSYLNNLVINDINNDGKKEILILYNNTDDNDTLYVLNKDGEAISQYTFFPKLTEVYNLIDINNDTIKDFITIAENKIKAFDGKNFDLIWEKSIDSVYKNFQLFLGDINKDGKLEILVACDDTPYLGSTEKSILIAFNLDGENLWDFDFANEKIYKLVLNNDFLLINSRYHTYYFNLPIFSNPTPTWVFEFPEKREDYYFNARALTLGDLDNNGIYEIYTASVDIYQIEQDGKNKIFFNNGFLVKKIIANDLDNDKLDEILVVDNYKIHLFNNDGNFLWSHVLFPTDITVCDLDGDSRKEIIVIGDNVIYAYNLSGNKLWENDSFNYPDKIICGDINKDGKNEIIVSDNGIYLLDNYGNIVNKNIDKQFEGIVFSLRLFDINQDGYDEIIFNNSSQTFILDKNLSIINNIPSFYSEDDILTTGEIENNPFLIIPTGYGIELDSYNVIKLFSENKDIPDASLYWTYNFPDQQASYIYFSPSDNTIFASYHSGIVALNATNGEEIWKYEPSKDSDDFINFGEIQIIDNTIFIGSLKLYALDKKGNLLYTFTPPSFMVPYGNIYSCPIEKANLFTDTENLILGHLGFFVLGEKGSLPTDDPIYNNEGEEKFLTINSGWELKALPLNNIVKPETFFDTITSVWKWNNGKWLVFSSNPEINELIQKYNMNTISTISPGEGFWVFSENNLTINFGKGNSYEIPYTFIKENKGWILAGTSKNIYPSEISNNVKDIITIWVWKNNNWSIWSPDNNLREIISTYNINLIDSLTENQGFWINKN